MTGAQQRAAEKSWGTRVIERRTGLGMSQESLAELAHVTQQTISKIELNLITPRVKTMKAIADALGTSVEVLFPWGSARVSA